MSNIEYSPEKWNLLPVFSLELTDESYEFDIIAAWVHKGSGVVYWAMSSGCSCPTPFEEFNKLSELKVGADTLQAKLNSMLQQREQWQNDNSESKYLEPYPNLDSLKVMEIMEQVQATVDGIEPCAGCLQGPEHVCPVHPCGKCEDEANQSRRDWGYAPCYDHKLKESAE